MSKNKPAAKQAADGMAPQINLPDSFEGLVDLLKSYNRGDNLGDKVDLLIEAALQKLSESFFYSLNASQKELVAVIYDVAVNAICKKHNNILVSLAPVTETLSEKDQQNMASLLYAKLAENLLNFSKDEQKQIADKAPRFAELLGVSNTQDSFKHTGRCLAQTPTSFPGKL